MQTPCHMTPLTGEPASAEGLSEIVSGFRGQLGSRSSDRIRVRFCSRSQPSEKHSLSSLPWGLCSARRPSCRLPIVPSSGGERMSLPAHPSAPWDTFKGLFISAIQRGCSGVERHTVYLIPLRRLIHPGPAGGSMATVLRKKKAK